VAQLRGSGGESLAKCLTDLRAYGAGLDSLGFQVQGAINRVRNSDRLVKNVIAWLDLSRLAGKC
jgi:hypothetical protein